MKFFNKLLPLQISLLLHGFAVLFLSWNSSGFQPQPMLTFDVVDHFGKVNSSSQASVKTVPKISAPQKEIVNADPISKDSSSDSVIPADDGLITEEPRVIAEPRIKQRTEEARRNGYTGVAKLKILIDVDGRVREVKLLNSLQYGLDERAIELARQIRLSPAKVHGVPVAVVRDFTINFKATD